MEHDPFDYKILKQIQTTGKLSTCDLYIVLTSYTINAINKRIKELIEDECLTVDQGLFVVTSKGLSLVARIEASTRNED